MNTNTFPLNRFAVLALMLFASVSLFASNGPEVEMTASTHDFGEVIKGVPVSHEFVIKNTGDEPLIIVDVTKPCGCQSASYTEKAIAPGEEGFVKATYNAAKEGAFVKAFTIKHNGGESKIVLRGKVVDNGVTEGTPEKVSIFSDPR